jgi:hypothetical protein
LAKFDPASSSWRTHQCLLFEDSTECLETLPRWGMMRGGELWELTPPALPTDETESGSWPTPVSSDAAARRPSKGWEGSDLPSVVWRRNGGDQNPNKSPVKLHPDWTEWLMGWPIGHTDLKPSATARFQQWCDSHGVCSPQQLDTPPQTH